VLFRSPELSHVESLHSSHHSSSGSGRVSQGGLSTVSHGHVSTVAVPIDVPIIGTPVHPDPTFAAHTLDHTNIDRRYFAPNVLQTEKKLVFPAFDGVKPVFQEWFMKVQNQLMKTGQDYLLQETETDALNFRDSKAVAIELFDKLTVSALQLFSSVRKHRHYVLGGRGIEMLHILAQKFNPLDLDAVDRRVGCRVTPYG